MAKRKLGRGLDMLISRGKAGDAEANCDAAKLIDRRWRETLTCTASLATELASRSRCRLPGRGQGSQAMARVP